MAEGVAETVADGVAEIVADTVALGVYDTVEDLVAEGVALTGSCIQLSSTVSAH